MNFQVVKEIEVSTQEDFKVFGTYSMEIENLGPGMVELFLEGKFEMAMPPGALWLCSGRGIEVMFTVISRPFGWGTKLKVKAASLKYQPRITQMSEISKGTLVEEKRCRCGAHSIKSNKHSDYCDLYVEESA